MKIRLKAPDGYLYYDRLTNCYYSELFTNDLSRYTVVPASQKEE